MRPIAILLLFVMLAITIQRNELWRDDEGIWGDSVAKAPRKARSYNELGLHYLSAGRLEDGFRTLRQSLAIDPYQPAVYINLGLAYDRLGRTEDAVKTYERAVFLNPDDPAAYYNLGVLTYTTLKDRDRALSYFLAARDRDPLEPDVHDYLWRIYEEKGNRVRAKTEHDLFLQLKR